MKRVGMIKMVGKKYILLKIVRIVNYIVIIVVIVIVNSVIVIVVVLL
jgi:hypothetical protein